MFRHCLDVLFALYRPGLIMEGHPGAHASCWQRLNVLQKHVHSAIRMGKGADNDDLINFDDETEIAADGWVGVENTEFMEVKDAGLELAPLEAINTAEIMLSSEVEEELGQIVVRLVKRFEAVVDRQQIDEEKWHEMYEAFLVWLVERRSTRVSKWVEVNTQRFEKEEDVQKFKEEVKAMVAKLKSTLTLCSSKCEFCYLKCLLMKGHMIAHSCQGTHHCSRKCTYCTMVDNCNKQLVLDCGFEAGHPAGDHDCMKKTHTCAQECIFATISSNCKKTCSLRVDHKDAHLCNSNKHMCKEMCSVPNCTNTCITPYEQGDHKEHACHETYCSAKCSMMGCNRCCVKDHFHKLTEDVAHFCPYEHLCARMCEEPGICGVQRELLKKKKLVEIEAGLRKQCCIKIPPYRTEHDGPHKHSTHPNDHHYCTTKCPTCGYYCISPFNHTGPHVTPHMNRCQPLMS